MTDGLDHHVASICRQRELRRAMCRAGLVAFISDGAVLPRESGVAQGPLEDAVPFASPESLAVTLEVDGEAVRGMGVPEGVTVIVGGGFHGKSTLLNAMQRGHLDHIPGDGREGVVAHPHTVKIRAEDGRRVAAVDISGFLSDLPGGRETRPFDTDDASGSTSQAAAIVEAIESGAEVLLIDEDTSATNLLARDALMRALIPTEREPITPFVERVRCLRCCVYFRRCHRRRCPFALLSARASECADDAAAASSPPGRAAHSATAGAASRTAALPA